MKILHISAYDNLGGGARAAYRLHKALLQNGIDSKMLVLNKSFDEIEIINLLNTPLRKLFDSIIQLINYLPIKNYKKEKYITYSTSRISTGYALKFINSYKPDIVHLHWIGFSMLSINEIKQIQQPLIWTFHDSWPFTGGCHVPYPCLGFMDKCGKCPQLSSESSKDYSNKILRTKIKKWKSTKINIITPSKWMTECVKNSSLYSQSTPITIPNGLDIEKFKPCKKEIARDIFNLPIEKNILLFGAFGATDDKNKGFHLLLSALEFFKDFDNIEVLVFGSSQPSSILRFPFPIKFLGKIHDDTCLSLIYSSADVMIVPSMTESFGQTALESMACGTPVVAFNASGLKDIIDHKVDGYLAKPYDSEDLASGITWILSNQSNYKQLSTNARKKVIDKFTSQQICQKYIFEYDRIIKLSK